MSMQPTGPQSIFENLIAYQRSAVLDAAIRMDLFTAVGRGAVTLPAIARACEASERGVRSLCDYLVTMALLEKQGDRYALSTDAASWLDRRSPTYLGSIAEFLCSSELRRAFDEVGEAVRLGRTAAGEEGLMAPDHPAWVKFARGMAVMAAPQAEQVAEILMSSGARPSRVLDVAAGHGLYGIAVARRVPGARVVFQDWRGVLAVAEENAHDAGLTGRFELLCGDVRELDIGGPYDLVLAINFLHHFDEPSGTRFLGRVRRALAPGGRLAVLESLVEEDRVSPAHAAAFSLVMLVTTSGGDAFTREQIERLLRDAGFSPPRVVPLTDSPQQLIVTAA